MDPFRRYSQSKSKVVRNREKFWTVFLPSQILGGRASKNYTQIIIIIIIIINAKIKLTLNTNVAGALYKNYQTK